MTTKDTFARAAWPLLGNLPGSIALLVLAILFAAGLIFGVLHYSSLVDLDFRQIRGQQAESRNSLARVREDEMEIRERIHRYQQLVAHERTQPEHRIDWVETIRRIKEKRRLISLDYEIAPQRPLDPHQPPADSFRYMVSPMKLDMHLLHENDLLGLLSDLKSQVQAIVSVRQCTIERLPASGTQPTNALLRAQCEIDWITLQEKS